MPELVSLDFPTEPYWLALPRGVRVRVRPLDTPTYKAAEARMYRKLDELRAAVAAVREEGGEVSGLPDISDPDVARGMAEAMLIAALAEIGIVAWEGVAAPLSREAAAQLMRQSDLAADFLRQYLAPRAAASAEGNGFAAGSGGTSEPGGAIAKGA